jgi:MoaA/NifB/PqqE/SkfB family radical SAM enzyme
MSHFKLDQQYKYKLQSMPRGKNDQTTITNRCNIPYNAVVVDYNSNCFICDCDGWLPIPVGNVFEFDTLQSIWDSPTAKLLQQDIDSKKYTWCAVDHCGIKSRNMLASNARLHINIDESCNLHCPSCRRDALMHSSGPDFEKKLKSIERVMSWLDQYKDPITITLSGNGDPLASHIIRPLFKKYTPRENQKFILSTNGLLIKKLIADSAIFSNIELFLISVDAGSAEVYENVRRGGKWEILIENFDYLKSVNKNHDTNLKFALQKNNYKDLFRFVELCNKYQFSGNIHSLDDWGTWNFKPIKNPDAWTIMNGTFVDHNILNVDHPEHAICMGMLREIKQQNLSNIKFNIYQFNEF